jgi:hypothetical protein
VPDDRMLWTGNTLMLFAGFPTIKSVYSTVAELRRQSRHVFGVPMENRPPMTWRVKATEQPILNELSEHSPGCTLRTPPARGPEDAEFKNGSPS